MSEPIIREISLKPPADPTLRRYSRVVAMVSELHKAGYQRIRLFPALTPNGGFLRAEITFADNTSLDGFPINDAWVARYSTGDGSAFFGWRDAADMNARQLAAAFVERFPEIARKGQGRDWAYAGWLSEILGQAEVGDPIILWADGDCLSDEHLALWKPPAFISETRVLPPLHTHIPNDALNLEIVPDSNFGWDRLGPFCTYYDGDDGGRRTLAACGDIAQRVFADVANASMDDLRIALFFQQRKTRWNDHMPVQQEDVDEIRPVIAEIRRRVEALNAEPPRGLIDEFERNKRGLPAYAQGIMDRHKVAVLRFRAEELGAVAKPDCAPDCVHFEAADLVWTYFLSQGFAGEERGLRNDVALTIRQTLKRWEAQELIPAKR